MTSGERPYRLVVRLVDGSSIVRDFPDANNAGAVLKHFVGEAGKLAVLRFANHDGTLFHTNPENIAFIGVVRPDTCDLLDRFTIIEPRRG